MAVARWLAAAYADRPLEVYGSLERTRDLTDVREVGAGCSRPRRARPAPIGVLNVGTGRPHTLAELVDAVAEATGRAVRTRLDPGRGRSSRPTPGRHLPTASVVGFVPRTDLDDVVRRQLPRPRWLDADRPAPLAVGA